MDKSAKWFCWFVALSGWCMFFWLGIMLIKSGGSYLTKLNRANNAIERAENRIVSEGVKKVKHLISQAKKDIKEIKCDQ